ncbi:hypothetical protein [Paenibacillus sp. FSL K6-1230]|uniref:hypothetical protein n=1 Tax=Paenibacillus sp. FSL K6-1230 TaxID=2921603 RepID=UPI0030FC04D2
MKWWKCGGSVALGAVLLLSSQPAVLAANAADVSVSKPLEAAYWNAPSLPVAQAEQKLLEPNNSKVYALPSKQRVYVYTQQPVVKSAEGQETSDSYLYTLQAFNDQTGESLWQYTFQSKDGDYAKSLELMPTESGSFYAYVKYTDGTNKVMYLSDKGKEVWSKEVSEGSVVKLVKGELLYVFKEEPIRQNGTIATNVYRYNTTGQLLGQMVVSGSLKAADKDRIILDAQRFDQTKEGWKLAGNPILNVYDLDFRLLNSYTLPNNYSIQGNWQESFYALDDSTFMLRVKSAGVTSDMILGFDKDGIMRWDFALSSDDQIKLSGTYFLLFNEHSIARYYQTNKVVQRTYPEDSIRKEGITFMSDGSPRVQLSNHYEVLDTVNLQHVRSFSTGYADAPSVLTDTAYYAIVDNKLIKQIIK